MAQPPYGYREGGRCLIPVKIDSSSSDIRAGDALTLATAGYFKQAASGEQVHCIAVEKVSSPDADGDVEILADFGESAVYEYPPSSGTVTQALVGTLLDLGGPQAIDIAASADDCFLCVRVDTAANTCFVKLNSANARF